MSQISFLKGLISSQSTQTGLVVSSFPEFWPHPDYTQRLCWGSVTYLHSVLAKPWLWGIPLISFVLCVYHLWTIVWYFNHFFVLKLLKNNFVVLSSIGSTHHKSNCQCKYKLLWPVWLSWLEHCPIYQKVEHTYACSPGQKVPWSGHIPRLWVQSPARVYTGGNRSIFQCLSVYLSHPLPLSV